MATTTVDDKVNSLVDDVEGVRDGETEETAQIVDHIAERQLCFKFDIRLMPVLAIMCPSS